ncbi:PrsW family intramembrane metalloprotease [Arthrobacter sp. zg-Y826]|uniref:PrsW family intramembrane metalloprotease n=1 Tax=Arthrobacter jinronghuae TaxID=2964609 RepID=UPI002104DD21|nr:PrsW family intramembrane metalloprotease [Arthrobacter jinronghuae]MCQ1956511.1 PrsW family intramembrane metalloprotease [Arthrobacter jinronghuae]
MSAPGIFPAQQQHPAPPGYGPANGAAPVQAFWSPPAPRRDKGLAATVVLIALSAVALAWVGMYLVDGLGPPAFIICGLLALVPLGICVLGIWWVDRWEPEPRSSLVFSFLWGAGVSVAIALLVGPYFTYALLELVPYGSADLLGAVVQAPVVEEIAKGLGILLLLLVRRRIFDGPVDGIVFAAAVAAGFAFTENILYFGSALRTAGPETVYELGFIFILRGLLSPFAHVLFTACTGLALGLAARRAGNAWILPAFVLGLIPAMLGHMLWNGGPALFFGDFFLFYFLLQVPFFGAAVTGVWLLRRAEQRLTLRRLSEYATAGWFTPAEVRMLATGAGRRQAMGWARATGAAPHMKEFIRRATRLALTRQQIASGRDVSANMEYERTLLGEVTGIRTTMLAGQALQPR